MMTTQSNCQGLKEVTNIQANNIPGLRPSQKKNALNSTGNENKQDASDTGQRSSRTTRYRGRRSLTGIDFRELAGLKRPEVVPPPPLQSHKAASGAATSRAKGKRRKQLPIASASSKRKRSTRSSNNLSMQKNNKTAKPRSSSPLNPDADTLLAYVTESQENIVPSFVARSSYRNLEMYLRGVPDNNQDDDSSDTEIIPASFGSMKNYCKQNNDTGLMFSLTDDEDSETLADGFSDSGGDDAFDHTIPFDSLNIPYSRTDSSLSLRRVASMSRKNFGLSGLLSQVSKSRVIESEEESCPYRKHIEAFRSKTTFATIKGDSIPRIPAANLVLKYKFP